MILSVSLHAYTASRILRAQDRVTIITIAHLYVEISLAPKFPPSLLSALQVMENYVRKAWK